jgi:fructokinase
VPGLHTGNGNLYLQDGTNQGMVAVLGEVLWDVLDHSRRLGGALLNFAAHTCRLGYDPLLISAVGVDSLGEESLGAIEAHFTIERPAACDSIRISDRDLEQLASYAPGRLYHGTRFASTAAGEAALCGLVYGLPAAARFYDLNLRAECWNAPLVTRFLWNADAVKLNEEEFERVQDFTGLQSVAEAFCREGAARYGWQAVCVTFGARGCAILVQDDYVEARGHCVDVADPVGAGDAFAAAFMHGLISKWPAAAIAAFANRVGALVASRHGAIPAWTLEEVVAS